MPDAASADPLRPWVVARGATVHNAAVAQPIPEMGGGFGVVAATDLPPRTTVASIPKKLLVTAKVARKRCGLPSSVPAVDAIVIFLVTERLEASETDDEGAPWAGWVRRLPKAYDNFIEIEDAVDGELVNRVSAKKDSPHPNGARRSDADQASLGATIAHLFPIPRYAAKVTEELEVFHRLADRLLEDASARHFRHLSSASSVATGLNRKLIRWGFNSLMSRGFSYSEDVWAMMPWVDYFNYAVTANVHPAEPLGGIGRGGFDFTVAPGLPGGGIRKGGQLLLSYGVYSDFELAMWYGFGLCSRRPGDGGGPEWQHHENCAYIVSPMSDTDGEYPAGAGWAVELGKAIGCTTLPPSWSPVGRTDLGRCRFSREGCTPHFRMLVDDLASANGLESTDVARRLIAREISTKTPPAAAAAVVSSSELPLVRFARSIDADSLDLVETVAALDDDAFEAWLERDVDI